MSMRGSMCRRAHHSGITYIASSDDAAGGVHLAVVTLHFAATLFTNQKANTHSAHNRLL
jgi:hypothetical protein